MLKFFNLFIFFVTAVGGVYAQPMVSGNLNTIEAQNAAQVHVGPGHNHLKQLINSFGEVTPVKVLTNYANTAYRYYENSLNALNDLEYAITSAQINDIEAVRSSFDTAFDAFGLTAIFENMGGPIDASSGWVYEKYGNPKKRIYEDFEKLEDVIKSDDFFEERDRALSIATELKGKLTLISDAWSTSIIGDKGLYRAAFLGKLHNDARNLNTKNNLLAIRNGLANYINKNIVKIDDMDRSAYNSFLDILFGQRFGRKTGHGIYDLLSKSEKRKISKALSAINSRFRRMDLLTSKGEEEGGGMSTSEQKRLHKNNQYLISQAKKIAAILSKGN